MRRDVALISTFNADVDDFTETTLEGRSATIRVDDVSAVQEELTDIASPVYQGVRCRIFLADRDVVVRNDKATVIATIVGLGTHFDETITLDTYEGREIEIRAADVFLTHEGIADPQDPVYQGDRSTVFFRELHTRVVRSTEAAVQAAIAATSSFPGPGAGGTLQDAYDAATTPPQIDVNATPDAVTFDATVAGDVFAVRDVSDNDILRLSTTRVEIGQTVLQDSTLAVGTPLNYTISDTFTTGAGFIGGVLSSQGNVTYNNALFIWALLAENKTYTGAVNPGFAAFTLFNSLPVITQTANVNLVSALVLNAGVTHQRTTAGTSVATNMITVSAANQVRATVSGAVMTRTFQIGLAMSPTFSTVAGSTANLGLIIGVQMNNPAQALFQPGAGTETATAIYGLVMNAMAFGGNITKAAVLSGLAAATNSYVILNTGTAQSDFGAGSAHWDDNAGIQLGGTTNASRDVFINWNASALEFDFAQNSDVLLVSNPNAGQILFDVGADEYTFNTTRGFALGAQTGTLGNTFGAFVFGASATQIAGEYSQFLLTQAGNLTIDHNVNAYGWTINAPSFTAGTGTLTTAAALNVGGNPGLATQDRIGVRIISNPSGGSGINAALWVTAGLSRFDGRVDINRGIALGGGAAATLGTIGGSGPSAAAQAQWVEIDVGGVAHWIPAWT